MYQESAPFQSLLTETYIGSRGWARLTDPKKTQKKHPHPFSGWSPQDPHASVRKEKILVDEFKGPPKSTGDS
jgi:hypothetical protein